MQWFIPAQQKTSPSANWFYAAHLLNQDQVEKKVWGAQIIGGALIKKNMVHCLMALQITIYWGEDGQDDNNLHAHTSWLMLPTAIVVSIMLNAMYDTQITPKASCVLLIHMEPICSMISVVEPQNGSKSLSLSTVRVLIIFLRQQGHTGCWKGMFFILFTSSEYSKFEGCQKLDKSSCT